MRGVKGTSPMTTLECAKCGVEFQRVTAIVKANRARHGIRPAYCSRNCNDAARKIVRTKECLQCGSPTRQRSERQSKYCSHACRAAAFSARVKNTGKGHIRSDGYHVVKHDGKNVKLHTLVMEKKLGRKLFAHENVHHINGDRADNRPENLELWTRTQPCGQRVVDRLEHSAHFLQQYGIEVPYITPSVAISGIAGLV